MTGMPKWAVLMFFLGSLNVSSAGALTLEELSERIETLSEENRQLRKELNQLKKQIPSVVVEEDLAPLANDPHKSESVKSGTRASSDALVFFDHGYSYQMLDPTTDINRKQVYLLSKKASGELREGVYLGGALTPIIDYQKSNTASKFGYLMRHPTSANQRTKTVSEAVIHSAQIQLTANVNDWISGYMELLYDPEQSFGAGTITDVNRNQVQVRRAYVLFGDLTRSPYYGSLGKMAIPFGLTDTVNPFTASTVWHAFGGLAYGANGGYLGDRLSINLMAVQGGAQFRAANVPVDDTNVPSKLNNLAIDVNYNFDLGESGDRLLVGASYIKGSAYCQDYPVTHFSSCEEENGAYDLYGRLVLGDLSVQAEYAQTEDEWPGTFNPDIPQYGASKVSSWDIGGKYRMMMNDLPVDFSADFSRFEAGPGGSPWEKQDQFVLGGAVFPVPSVKLFGELIRTEGYAPLNFISGGNLPAGQSHSNRDATSNILMLGTNIVF